MLRKLIVIFILPVFMLSFFIPVSTVNAATIYWVAPDGDDNNPGTEQQPFKTIQKAADTALAGDTVMIKPGVYTETVTVKNSGDETNPIVFQAEKYKTVTIQNPNSYVLFQSGQSATGKWSSYYVTVRGITFGPSKYIPFQNDEENCSFFAAKGWRIEDCVFEKSMRVYLTGNRGNVDNVVFLRTIFQDMYEQGVGIIRARKVQFIHCIFRRNNYQNFSPGWYAGANKFLYTDGMIYDGVISYDNNGTGTWFDYDNKNFVVRNCSFFGNHAGYSKESDGSSNDHSWAGVGFWSEANGGPALIENNVFYSNSSTGFGDLDSGKDGAITVQNNIFVDNYRAIEFRAMEDGSKRYLGAANVINNVFKSMRGPNWSTSSVGNYRGATQPGQLNIIIDHNTYDPIDGYASYWAVWNNKAAKSLEEIQSIFGAEANGKQERVAWKGTLFKVSVYPRSAKEAANPDMTKFHQIPSETAEATTIDEAIADKKVGDQVTIPVYGRTPITDNGDGTYTAEVHDLQARYVKLLLKSEADKTMLESEVTPYAIIDTTEITVTLTKKEEYALEAVFGTQDAIEAVDAEANSETTEEADTVSETTQETDIDNKTTQETKVPWGVAIGIIAAATLVTGTFVMILLRKK